MTSEPIAYPNYLWWVKPPFLGGMPRPPLEDLPILYQAGLRGIVSVMDELSGIEAYREAGFKALWLPTIGGTAPKLEQVQAFVEFADPLLEQQQAVAVHCTSGNRRTGTLLAAYLIAKGELPERAIATIQQARPAAELRAAQLDFLTSLPDLL
ncbi:MAG: protein phosphatase [Chloroflexaceae bacterium]|nr:protein phosphatase [Chloroflexaceae bacterium]